MDLDFREVIALVNRTGVLTIAEEPSELEGGRWSIYESHVRVGLLKVRLYLLYLMSGLSARDELARAISALQKVKGGSAGQIVYADSLVEDNRFPALGKPVDSDGIPRQGVRAFFVSLAEQQLTVYLGSLKNLNLRNYIDPELVMFTNGDVPRHAEIGELVRGQRGGRGALPELNVLIAEPGQGKTYFCSYLAQRAATAGRIPFLVSANQWETMAPGDLQSIWKTILNALQHFNAPIPWAEGAEEEFVKVAQKSGSFTLIFDGFDEYVLRRSNSVSAPEILQSFRDLALSTSSQILLTSRTAFWDAGGAEVFSNFKDSNLKARSFAIMPFSREHAHTYFGRRLLDRPDAVRDALNIFDKLGTGRGGHSTHLVGRGFLLSLIADLSERRETFQDAGAEGPFEKPLDWLCESFCIREDLRQGLGIPARKQLAIFEELAEAVAIEGGATTETITLLIEISCDFDPAETVVLTGIDGTRPGKLAYHPLLKQRPDHRWVFSEDQLYYLFVARRVLALLSNDRHSALFNFLDRVRDARQLHFELAGALLYLLSPSTRGFDKIKQVVSELIDIESKDDRTTGGRSSIAASLAILAVNEAHPRGADKLERRELLQKIIGTPISRLHLSDTLTNFDFRSVVFQRCRFENISFVRCEFDKTTRFIDCRFNGVTSLGSRHLGRASFSAECVMDPEFRALIALDAIGSTRVVYTRDDLRADVELALLTLLPAETRAAPAISEHHLLRGRIGSSPLRRQILDALHSYVLEASGDPKRPLRLSDAALPAIQFHRANGVFTGPLAELWGELESQVQGPA